MFAVFGLGCGRLGFDALDVDDAGTDADPVPLACGEIRVLGTTTYPALSGDREISAAATDEGAVVVWNTAATQLVGVGLTLADDVGIHGFGTELAASPVFAVGVAALGNLVLTAAGTDSPAGSTRVQQWTSRLVQQTAPVTLPISSQERDVAFETGQGDFGITGIAGGLPGVRRIPGAATSGIMRTYPTPNPVSESVGIGTQVGMLTATTTDLADSCTVRRLAADLVVQQEVNVDVTLACDNPRFAYDPASDRYLMSYSRGGIRVQVDSATTLTAAAPRLAAPTGESATPAWDGSQFWIVYRVGPEPAELVAHPLDLAGLDLAPPITLTGGLPERAYSAFVFDGRTYAVWIGVDQIMRLSRICR